SIGGYERATGSLHSASLCTERFEDYSHLPSHPCEQKCREAKSRRASASGWPLKCCTTWVKRAQLCGDG
ncbi:hypothetical protein M5D96_007487, partial [Drosophila gunungcola]